MCAVQHKKYTKLLYIINRSSTYASVCMSMSVYSDAFNEKKIKTINMSLYYAIEAVAGLVDHYNMSIMYISN